MSSDVTVALLSNLIENCQYINIITMYITFAIFTNVIMYCIQFFFL